MEQEKAKYVRTKYDKGNRIDIYNYKGYEYEITYNTEWTLKEQHKTEQLFIENMIKQSDKKLTTEHAMVGLNAWFDYLDN